MLAVKQAFPAETISDVIAGILAREPDWGALPDATPQRVRELLRRCLQKDVAKRLRHIDDARLELEDGFVAPLAVAAPVPAASRRSPLQLAAAVLVGAILAGAAVWSMKPPPPAPARSLKRLVIPVSSADVAGTALALSPNGSGLVYQASRGGQLYMRALDQEDATLLRGTEGGSNPFFSPDGQWVGLFAGQVLKKIAVSGGAAQTLCSATFSRGGSWGADDTIVFSSAGGLQRVSAAGGKPEVLTKPEEAQGERAHLRPYILPGGRAVLFVVQMTNVAAEDARIVVQDLKTGQRRVLAEGGMQPQYAATGHLVLARGGGLMAAPFDLKELRVTGTPVPILDGWPGRRQRELLPMPLPATARWCTPRAAAREKNSPWSG